MHRFLTRNLIVMAGLACAGFPLAAHAQLPAETKPPAPPARPDRNAPIELAPELQKMVEGAKPLNPKGTVLLDKEKGRLLLKTRVCLREGLLEMLLCKSQTKEHESILTIDSDAYVIHGGLLAIGAAPGRPVRFEPEFQAPTGDRIDVWLNWVDADGKPQRTEAQRWVRGLTRRYYGEKIGPLPKGLEIPKDGDLKYYAPDEELIWFGMMSDAQRDEYLALSKDAKYQAAIKTFHDSSQPRQMQADFIFAGSGFQELKDGTKFYQAEGGNLICVANFGDAMIDVSVRSSDMNSQASFEPYTERVPALGTPVLVELIPAKSDKTKKD